jgi:hypothetical protein
MPEKRWDDPSKPDVELSDLMGTVRRHPDGTVLAVLWPSPPHPARWMVTDEWGSLGYERNRAVATWPIVGAVPFSPAAGMSLTPTRSLDAVPAPCPCGQPIPAGEKHVAYCSDECKRLEDDHGPEIDGGDES